MKTISPKIDTRTIRISQRDLDPPQIRSGELRRARYEICPFGLASDTVGDVVVDGRIAFIQPHPGSTIYLCPLSPHPQPTSAEAWFYCDCVAFEHDIPVIVYPTHGELSSFNYRYIHSGRSKPRTAEILHIDEANSWREPFVQQPIPPTTVTRTFLLNQLTSILDETREMRHGPLTFVLFRTYRHRRRVDLRYSEKYGRVTKELGLFSAALRQPDFLAEYLGYYRVIESVTKTNGKDWIAQALQRLAVHRWPKILLGHEHAFEQKPRNIIGICLRRASIRLKQLNRQLGGNNNIAHYFYNVNRCGIAHGKDAVVRGDITPTYFDVARDSMILKLLARMAIDEKR